MSMQNYQAAITTVLLIEDDEEDFILLRKVLSRIPHASYKVLWEQSFEDGLAHMQHADHDICLVDYRLGASSGIELLQAARKEGYSRPIIMLTGATGGDIDIQALQAGADDYVTKELLQGELLYRMMRYAIERRKAEQERERLLREQITRDEREARRNEFISMVVHELKTPLSSLKGYAQLLSRRNKRAGDEQAESGLVRQGRPHLLTSYHPFVAVTYRPGGERGDIGTGAGLGKQLAPDFLTGEQWP